MGIGIVVVFVVMMMMMMMMMMMIILSSSFSGNSQSFLSGNPAAYIHNTFSKIWAVPDNCAFPKIFGRLNLPYQAFAFPEIVPSGKITVGFTVTLVALWIPFIFRWPGLDTFPPFPPQ